MFDLHILPMEGHHSQTLQEEEGNKRRIIWCFWSAHISKLCATGMHFNGCNTFDFTTPPSLIGIKLRTDCILSTDLFATIKPNQKKWIDLGGLLTFHTVTVRHWTLLNRNPLQTKERGINGGRAPGRVHWNDCGSAVVVNGLGPPAPIPPHPTPTPFNTYLYGQRPQQEGWKCK